jgi:hypothetical protein
MHKNPITDTIDANTFATVLTVAERRLVETGSARRYDPFAVNPHNFRVMGGERTYRSQRGEFNTFA